MLIPNPDLGFWNSYPQNLFLDIFGPKKSNLSFLLQNWNKWYPEDSDSYSNISCLNFHPTLNPFLGKFGPKKSKLSVLPKNWHTLYLEDTDSYSSISFLNFKPKIHFWANLGKKSFPFCLKIGIHRTSRILIFISIFVSWVVTKNPFLGKFRSKKLKLSVLPKNWHAWYLEDLDSYSETSFLNSFLGRVKPRKWNCLFFRLI